MLRLYSHEIVFREVPNEVTLALNFSMCQSHCEGCHSPWLWTDQGIDLTQEMLTDILDEPKNRLVTCVAFMGGNNDTEALFEFNKFIKKNYPRLKTCWYTSFDYKDISLKFPQRIKEFNYIKFGKYDKDRGGLDNPNTNQAFFKIYESGLMTRMNSEFQKNGRSIQP